MSKNSLSDGDSDDFDIDDIDESVKKKLGPITKTRCLFRKRRRCDDTIDDVETKNKKVSEHDRSLSLSSIESDDDDDTSKASQDSFMSIRSSPVKIRKQSSRRSALERLKNKSRHRDSDSEQEEPSESDSDFLNDDEFENDLESGSCSGSKAKSAIKFIDDNDNGCALKAFYRNTLGLEVESTSESGSNLDELTESIPPTEPPPKRRKLNTNNDSLYSMKKKNEDQCFGGLPISVDLMDKIARYLTLTEISQVLVLVNHEFCGYFNTDKFWKKLYSMMSKTVMNQKEKEKVKSYQWNYNHRLYKRRILWYYCHDHDYFLDATSIEFDIALNAYIPSFKYQSLCKVNPSLKRPLYIDREFMIKCHLIRECAIMHRHKKDGEEQNDQNKDSKMKGVDELYLIRDEAMNIILPQKRYHEGYQHVFVDQFVAVLGSTCNGSLEILHAVYDIIQNSLWKSPSDIFNGFRGVNQLFVNWKLNAMITESVKDLQFMSKLQAFYERSMGNSSGLIREFCSDYSTIHDEVQFQITDSDQITLTIDSPKNVMHEQMRYAMMFINQYDARGRLCCLWETLKQEMKERRILQSDAEFENLKTLVDDRRFHFKGDAVLCKDEL